MNEDEDEQWIYQKDESYESAQEVESVDVIYGETVFFKNEQITEMKRLKPLTDEFPEFTIELYPFVLGKLKGAVDGAIDHETVSRIHCKIEYEEGGYFITDLNSTNGTILNDDMLNANEKRSLNSGDELRIGRAVYVFQ